jgi:hypothetical protein
MACKAIPEADPELGDALVSTLRDFDMADEDLAFRLRSIERQLYTTLDVEANDESKRSVAPSVLTVEDVDHYDQRPDADPSTALRVATAGTSPFDITLHGTIPPEPDQRPLEPFSPDHYDREFLTEPDCWAEQDCESLGTFQELTKKNGITQSVTYEFFKDFRWVDIHADLRGEEPRWVMFARSWNPDSYVSGGGDMTLIQSYTIEYWFPRDGRGFRWETAELEEGQEMGTADSDGSGTLRLLSLWTEQDLSLAVSEGTERGTIRWGQERNFKAHDAWLEETYGAP